MNFGSAHSQRFGITKSFSVGGAGSLNERCTTNDPGGRGQGGGGGGSGSNNSSLLTMREYDETIRDLRKENFNLKLRIYFMEESQGLLHSPKEQAELYKVNIDLKVKSEELKKVTYT